MKTRRNFIQNGSFAAAAVLAINPLESLANNKSILTNNTNVIGNKVLNLLHSHKPDVLQKATMLKKKNSAVFLNPTRNLTSIGADVEMSAIENEDYRIVYKDDIKIGVITAIAEHTMIVETANYLALFLKTTKNCDTVVCLSNLGFKATNQLDDITLAEKSMHVDVIISGHETNYCKRPFIAVNSHKEEVIINHSSSNVNELGKISIGFDKHTGKKSNIVFVRK